MEETFFFSIIILFLQSSEKRNIHFKKMQKMFQFYRFEKKGNRKQQIYSKKQANSKYQ